MITSVWELVLIRASPLVEALCVCVCVCVCACVYAYAYGARVAFTQTLGKK